MGQAMETFGQQMGAGLAGTASGALGSIVSTGLGLLLEHHNDKRQLAQQQKLGEQQLGFNEQMADYNQQLQMKTWNDTNYAAQVGQLNKAGLNPGLLYGGGGGGGATVGGQGGQVSAPSAPSGGHEILDIRQQALQTAQLQLLQAQKENLQASANQANAEADATRGYKANLAGAQTISTEAQTALTNLQSKLQNATLEDQTAIIHEQLGIVMANERSAVAQANVDAVSQEDRIKTIAAQAIGTVLQNTLTKAQTSGALSNIEVNKEQIQKMANDIAQGWTGLNLQQQNIAIQKFQAEMKANYPGISDVVGRLLNDNITQVFTDLFGKKPEQQYKVK